MQVLENLVNDLKLGEPISFQRLTMFPLNGSEGQSFDYLTLDEALRTGTASVTEISASGSVPDLKFLNTGDKPIFLLDGEELVGAKQNRILNLSVLIPGNSDIIIPVSCVEQGRWAKKSSAFASSSNAATPEMRKILKESKREARKAFVIQQQLEEQCDEAASMVREHAAVHHASQGAVWDKVETMQFMHISPSQTSSMEDVFESKRNLIERALQTFKYPQDARGWIIAINGEIQTIEMFGKKRLCKSAWERVMRMVLCCDGPTNSSWRRRTITLKVARI